jgi:hypothetical protein
MLERDLQIDLIKSIKSIYGEDVWVFKTHDQVRVGIPDIILCFCGHFVAIELKKPIFYKDKGRYGRSAEMKGERSVEAQRHIDGKDLEPLQRYNIMLINRAGGSAFHGRYHGKILQQLAKIYNTINKIY